MIYKSWPDLTYEQTVFSKLTNSTITKERSWLHEDISNKDILLITVGDSWTWGDSLFDIDISTPNYDNPNRVKHIYGAKLAELLNADFVNVGECGGKIINSAGQVDAEAWGKPAPWCDYHGPVDGERVGIAFLNHPSSYRFPTRWHVRNYGLFTANPFMSRQVDKTLPDGTIVPKAGERLKLRHRFILHSGDAESASIAALYAKYAQEEK